jgi:eukaryotic-like serine/threonine-protein kinase
MPMATQESHWMPSNPDAARRALAQFDALVDLDPSAQAARLRALRAEDPALAEELTRLLRADATPDSLIDRGFREVAATLVERVSDVRAAVAGAAGQRIGPFQLDRLLGRGGMGEVWLATRHEGDFQQEVALKLLLRGIDGEDRVRRFVQERRILAELSHPAIARFIDGGFADDGTPWYAMERVDGLPLTEYARRNTLDVRARLALMADVAEAVAYAQNRLVVHRDLKPSNILVDADGRVHLLDFGIAKLLQADSGFDHTATGMRAMSPAYAAPEQILDEPISTATDVYALGVVLHELLTGSLPHRREGAALQTLAERVRHETVERPSLRLRDTERTSVALGAAASTVTRFAREIAGELDTIVLTALRREPERRYATAAAFADDLRRWLAGRPVAAQPDTRRYRLRKFVARHRLAVGSASAVLLALIAGFGTALWQATVAQSQAQRAEREAASARDMATRSDRVKEFLISVFLQEDPVRRDARGALTMAEAFEDALTRIDSEFADDPAMHGDLLDDFGEIVNGRGDFVRARGMFERALAIAERVHGENDPAVAEVLLNLAAANAGEGREELNRPLAERAIRILQARQPHDAGALANAHNALASALRNEGDLPAAITHTQRALALAGGPEGAEPLVPVALYNLATMLAEAERIDEAEPIAQQAIAAIERQQGPDAAPLAIVLTTLESVLEQRGDTAGVTRLTERRLAIARQHFPGDHPWKSAALADSGWQLVREGRAEEGEARIREAIAAFDRQGDDAMAAQSARRRLALSLIQRDAPDEAAVVLDAAIDSCRAAATLDNQMCLTLRANRAHLAALLGDFEAALAEADTVERTLAQRFGSDLDERAQALEARASALAGLQRRDQARAAQSDALRIYQALYDGSHRSVRRAQQRLAALQGEADAAR